MGPDYIDPNRECCRHCHFFGQLLRNEKDGQKWTNFYSLDLATRAGFEAGTYPLSVLRASGCGRGVWSPAYDQLQGVNEDLREKIRVNRAGRCFFLQYSIGMTLDTAIEIQRSNAADYRAAEDRKLTRRAFWISVAALIVSVLSDLGWSVYSHFHPYKEPPPVVTSQSVHACASASAEAKE